MSGYCCQVLFLCLVLRNFLTDATISSVVIQADNSPSFLPKLLVATLSISILRTGTKIANVSNVPKASYLSLTIMNSWLSIVVTTQTKCFKYFACFQLTNVGPVLDAWNISYSGSSTVTTWTILFLVQAFLSCLVVIAFTSKPSYHSFYGPLPYYAMHAKALLLTTRSNTLCSAHIRYCRTQLSCNRFHSKEINLLCREKIYTDVCQWFFWGYLLDENFCQYASSTCIWIPEIRTYCWMSTSVISAGHQTVSSHVRKKRRKSLTSRKFVYSALLYVEPSFVIDDLYLDFPYVVASVIHGRAISRRYLAKLQVIFSLI